MTTYLLTLMSEEMESVGIELLETEVTVRPSDGLRDNKRYQYTEKKRRIMREEDIT